MMAAVSLTSSARRPGGREAGAAAWVVVGALVKATVAALLPFMIVSRRRVAPILGALAALVLGALIGYVAFGIHGVNVVAALNRDAAFVSTDSFATEIAHLFGKPGVFPIDHDLLKAALVIIVLHLLWRTWRGYDWVAASGLGAARDLRHEHVAARVVHPVAAAARRGRSRPAAARGHARRAGAVHPAPDLAAVGARAMTRVWLVETTLLVLVGVLLAAATVNDLARQAHTNDRLIADLSTWRHYTGHDYHNISVDQETLGSTTQREVLCGNTSAGPPKAARRSAWRSGGRS